MRDLFRKDRLLVVLGLLALSSPLVAPLLGGNYPHGHDSLKYVPRLIEFHENVRHGILLPRWAPDLSQGCGQPFFVFAPPVIYWLGEIGLALGMKPTGALGLAVWLIVLGSAGSMYLLARERWGAAAAWIATAAYVYAPYFLVDLYVRTALAELAAFAFYPLVLWGLVRAERCRDPRYLLATTLGFAAVIGCHFPAALLFGPFLLAVAVFLARRARSWSYLAWSGLSVVLALGLTAVWWWPALAEMRFSKLLGLVDGYLHYQHHFVHPRQLVDGRWGFGLSVAGSGDDMSFSLGWPHLLLVAVLLWYGQRRPRRRGQRAWALLFAGAVVVGCLSMMPWAEWLWDHVRLLQYVEFPWRVLGPVALFLALLIGALVAPLRLRVWEVAVALILLIAPSLDHLRAYGWHELDWAEWTPEQIAARDVTATSRREYESGLAAIPTACFERRVAVVEGDAQVDDLQRGPDRWTLTVTAPEGAAIELGIHFFPGWTVRLDGVPVGVEASELTGLIRVRVPPGTTAVEARFEDTLIRQLARVVSLATLPTMLLVGLVLWRRRAGVAAPPAPGPGDAPSPREPLSP